MRIFSIRLFLLLMFFGFSFKLQAKEQLFIEVISSDSFPVTGIKALQQQGLSVKVYNLDDGKRLVAQIGANLPNNQNAAKNILQQRLKINKSMPKFSPSENLVASFVPENPDDHDEYVSKYYTRFLSYSYVNAMNLWFLILPKNLQPLS